MGTLVLSCITPTKKPHLHPCDWLGMDPAVARLTSLEILSSAMMTPVWTREKRGNMYHSKS